MRRKFLKLIGFVFGFAGLVLLLGAAFLMSRGDTTGSLFWLLFGGVLSLAGFRQYFRLNRFEKRNFEWYKRTYPESCERRRVACTSCEGTHIRVRGLMQHSYTREHFCGTCGKTLYYSPEG